MQKCFKKKIFTPGILAGDIKFMVNNFRRIVAIRREERLSHAFTEKIMSVVTAINGCIYCSWFHTREAAAAGMDSSEINDLFQLQFETQADDDELPALKFAQHYAETNRKPDPEATAEFKNYYGIQKAADIGCMIRVIFMGNLLGNTYDAFLSRLKGCPASGSSAVFEFFFFLLAFPLMFPASIIMKRDNKSQDASA